jgi:hypothetical protein
VLLKSRLALPGAARRNQEEPGRARRS